MADNPIQQTPTIIYGLIDPSTGHLRYVGKTKGSLNTRRLSHLNDVRRGRVYIPRHKWIAELLDNGREPEILEIELVEGSWQAAEQFWISYFRFIGCDLLNATAGGDGLCSYRHRNDTRAKQAASATKRYEVEGERERTGAAVRRGQNNPYFIARMKAARVNITPETRARLSAAAKIHRATPEARAAVSARMTGRYVSEETRRKLSVAKKGKKRSIEARIKQSMSRRGAKHSEATKAKIAASQDRHARAVTTRAAWLDPEYRAKQAKVDRAGMLKSLWLDPERRAERLAQQRAARGALSLPG